MRLLLLFWLSAVPAAADPLVLDFRNPGETLILDLLPKQPETNSAGRHKKINDYWEAILAANGYATVAVPTKTATGFVRSVAYHPPSGRTFAFHIQYSWDYLARVMLESVSDRQPVQLRLDPAPFERVDILMQAPEYCLGGRAQADFDRLSADERTRVFQANHCDPTAYQAQWGDAGEG
ncbi:MAG: hypothetical protein ACFB22_01020 [Rhodothalassiaceae bacterium]